MSHAIGYVGEANLLNIFMCYQLLNANEVIYNQTKQNKAYRKQQDENGLMYL